jgi:hypothetical protein
MRCLTLSLSSHAKVSRSACFRLPPAAAKGYGRRFPCDTSCMVRFPRSLTYPLSRTFRVTSCRPPQVNAEVQLCRRASGRACCFKPDLPTAVPALAGYFQQLPAEPPTPGRTSDARSSQKRSPLNNNPASSSSGCVPSSSRRQPCPKVRLQSSVAVCSPSHTPIVS